MMGVGVALFFVHEEVAVSVEAASCGLYRLVCNAQAPPCRRILLQVASVIYVWKPTQLANICTKWT